MPQTEKPTRVRPRPRMVTVELTEAERAKLEKLRANRGERATLVGTIRDLIREARR